MKVFVPYLQQKRGAVLKPPFIFLPPGGSLRSVDHVVGFVVRILLIHHNVYNLGFGSIHG